jgi:hypothetical protein
MSVPCPRCGTTKTESVRRGFIHDTLWNMGYHLRVCSFCNRWRVFKRLDPSQPHPDDMTTEQLREIFNQKIAESLRKDSGEPEPSEGNMAVEPAEESPDIEIQPTESSIGVAEAPVEDEEYGYCPKCGGMNYRRSRRRWWERMMNRPRMARCMKCAHRFPYPR